MWRLLRDTCTLYSFACCAPEAVVATIASAVRVSVLPVCTLQHHSMGTAFQISAIMLSVLGSLLGYIRQCERLSFVHHGKVAGCITCCMGQMHEGQHAR